MQLSFITEADSPRSASTGLSSQSEEAPTCITAMSMVALRTLAAAETQSLTKEALSEALSDKTRTLEEIATRFGVSTRTIGKRRKKWGLVHRERKSLCPQKASITREKLAPLWADPNESTQGIASKFDVTAQTLKSVADRFFLGPKVPKVPNSQRGVTVSFTKEQLEDLWTGRQLREIAVTLNCSVKTVRKWAKRWGLPDRGQPDPTEEEIYAMAAELRKSWPPHRFQ